MVLDREQGGKQLLQEKAITFIRFFSISEVVEILKEVDHLTEEEVLRINEFISGNKIEFKEEKKTFFEQKLENCEHSVGKKKS